MRAGLRLAVTLAALGLLAWWLDPRAIAARLAGADPLWLALAVALLAGQIVASALRWRLTAARLGLALGRAEAVGEYFLAVLANSLLPGGVLGDVARAARARHRAGTGPAALSVVMERALGQVALALAAGAGLAAWLWPAPGGWIALGTGAALAAAALWLRGPSRVAGLVRRVWIAGGAWRAQAALSALVLACNIGGFWAAAQAVGVALPWPAALPLIAAALAAMILPVSIAGWGLREGVAAALWPLAGVAPQAAVAAGIAFGLASLAAALPGLVPLAATGRHNRDGRA